MRPFHAEPGDDADRYDADPSAVEMPRQELCPDCFGLGRIVRENDRGQLIRIDCGECNGRGFYEEETE